MAKEDEGYLLDGSGNRVLSGSGEAVRTGSYDDDKVTQNRRKAAEDKLAEDVQEKLRADAAAEKKTAENKAPEKKSTLSNDGDVDESDRRKEVAASGPQRPRPARPGQSSSGRKPTAAKPTAKPSELTDKPSAPAAKSSEPATTTSKPAGASGLLDPQQKAQQKAQPSKPAASNKKPPPFEMPISKFFKAIRKRGEESLKGSGMKAGGSVKKAKGSSINGIAQRGLTNCKQR